MQGFAVMNANQSKIYKEMSRGKGHRFQLSSRHPFILLDLITRTENHDWETSLASLMHTNQIQFFFQS